MFSVFISEAQPILGNAKVCKPREEKRSLLIFFFRDEAYLGQRQSMQAERRTKQPRIL